MARNKRTSKAQQDSDKQRHRRNKAALKQRIEQFGLSHAKLRVARGGDDPGRTSFLNALGRQRQQDKKRKEAQDLEWLVNRCAQAEVTVRGGA